MLDFNVLFEVRSKLIYSIADIESLADDIKANLSSPDLVQRLIVEQLGNQTPYSDPDYEDARQEFLEALAGKIGELLLREAKAKQGNVLTKDEIGQTTKNCLFPKMLKLQGMSQHRYNLMLDIDRALSCGGLSPLKSCIRSRGSVAAFESEISALQKRAHRDDFKYLATGRIAYVRLIQELAPNDAEIFPLHFPSIPGWEEAVQTLPEVLTKLEENYKEKEETEKLDALRTINQRLGAGRNLPSNPETNEVFKDISDFLLSDFPDLEKRKDTQDALSDNSNVVAFKQSPETAS